LEIDRASRYATDVFIAAVCQAVLGSALWVQARATTIDPVGRVLLVDPLTFDGGMLQRGGRVAGGAGNDGARLLVAGESTFFRELSLRVDYTRDFVYGPRSTDPDGHRIGWRLRLPVIQSPRFGRVDSWQFHYRREFHIGDVNVLAPAHEVNMAFLWARGARTRMPSTHHLQFGPTVRDRLQAQHDGARAGLVIRGSSTWLVGQPASTGSTALSVSLLEATWLHYGLVDRRDGNLALSPISPALHVGRGAHAVSIGAFPEIGLRYTAEDVEMVWAGQLLVQSSQLPRLE
jgi:hypothetical protein